MGIAAAIGAVAVGTVASAAISSSASNKAANAARDAAAQNNALQAEIYDSNKNILTPSITSGQKATSAIDALLGTGGDATATQKAYDTWKASTGYQAALKTGQNSVTAALGAKGLTDSGAALKALTEYGQNTENQTFQTYLGNLQTQQQNGTAAGGALAGVGTTYANAVSANNTTAANQVGNAALANANTINSALGNLTGFAGFASSYR